MLFLTHLLKKLDTYAFQHQPPDPRYIPPLLHNFLQDYPQGFLVFLSTELKLATFYNTIFAIILFFVIPLNFSEYFACSPAATVNLLIICALNFLVLPLKALIFRRLREIQQFFAQELSEFPQTLVFQFFYCRIFNFNAIASKLLILAYLSSFYTFLAKFEGSPACNDASSLFFLGIFAIIAFFFKMAFTYLRFKDFYSRKYLGFGGMSAAELAKTQVCEIEGEGMLEKIREKQENCVICWEKFAVSQEIRTLNCKGKHFFHKKCVDQWLNNYSRCPVCNKTFFN